MARNNRDLFSEKLRKGKNLNNKQFEQFAQNVIPQMQDYITSMPDEIAGQSNPYKAQLQQLIDSAAYTPTASLVTDYQNLMRNFEGWASQLDSNAYSLDISKQIDAGLNPYLSGAAGSAGSAGSSGSTGSVESSYLVGSSLAQQEEQRKQDAIFNGINTVINAASAVGNIFSIAQGIKLGKQQYDYLKESNPKLLKSIDLANDISELNVDAQRMNNANSLQSFVDNAYANALFNSGTDLTDSNAVFDFLGNYNIGNDDSLPQSLRDMVSEYGTISSPYDVIANKAMQLSGNQMALSQQVAFFDALQPVLSEYMKSQIDSTIAMNNHETALAEFGISYTEALDPELIAELQNKISGVQSAQADAKYGYILEMTGGDFQKFGRSLFNFYDGLNTHYNQLLKERTELMNKLKILAESPFVNAYELSQLRTTMASYNVLLSNVNQQIQLQDKQASLILEGLNQSPINFEGADTPFLQDENVSVGGGLVKTAMNISKRFNKFGRILSLLSRLAADNAPSNPY